MSAILGIFGKRPLQSADLERLLVTMRARGMALKQCWLDSTGCSGLAVGRYEWERTCPELVTHVTRMFMTRIRKEPHHKHVAVYDVTRFTH